VGPAWIGDMVMAQGVFKALKRQDPQVSIGVLAPDWTRPLLERMPEVTWSHNMPIGHGALLLKKRYELARYLKSFQYDEAIVLPNSWKSALIPWFASIPKRTGYFGEARLGLLNDLRFLNKRQYPLMIERFIALAYKKNTKITFPIEFPSLRTAQPALEKTLEKFLMLPRQENPILGLCPGAEFGEAKRWPAEYFATVAREKIKAGWSVWLLGGKNDLPVANVIQEKTGNQCVNFIGKTTLEEAIDLLSLSSLVLTNDSGLMHIAAALQKPVMALYGSTDPTFTPPLTSFLSIQRLEMPCSPCFERECPLQHHNCMKQLLPEQILKAITRWEEKCAF
jgi:heptosyltransferase-2